MPKIVFCFLFLWGIWGKMQAQCTFSIEGHVLDEDTKEVLAFASIYVENTEIGTLSDEKGSFELKGVCAGNINLIIQHLGCGTKTYPLTISEDLHLELYLPHAENTLGKVLIQEKQGKQLTQAQEQVEGLTLNQNRMNGLGKSLSLIAGVSTLNTGASISKPVIHGMHSNRILILNNGVRQEGQQWGNEHAPEIDPYLAEKLMVIKGANAVRYGSDAIGGVILVEPRALRDSAGTSANLHLGAASNNGLGISSLSLEHSPKKIAGLAMRLQGTAKRSGNIHAPHYYLKNTGTSEYNYSGTIGYKKKNFGVEAFASHFQTQIGVFSAAHIGNLTDLDRAIHSDVPLESADFTYKIQRPSQFTVHSLSKNKAWLKLGKWGKISYLYAWQENKRKEYDKHLSLNDSIAALNLPALDLTISSRTQELCWEHYVGNHLSGMIGYSQMKQRNTYEGRLFIPDYLNKQMGIYAVERWRNDKWLYEIGARWDKKKMRVYTWENNLIQTNKFDFDNFSGTLGAVYMANPHYTISGNVASAWRAPAVNELFSNGLHHGAASVEIGDKTLQTEKALNTQISLQIQQDDYALEVDLYHNYINDFIYLRPLPSPTLTIRGAFPTFAYTQSDATLSGIDLMGKWNMNKQWQIQGKGAFLRPWNRSENTYLALMPPANLQAQLQYNLEKWKKMKTPYFALEGQYVAKQKFVPKNYQDYLPAPNAYFLLNFKLGADLPLGKKILCNAGIIGENILNTSYRDYMDRFRYFTDGMGRNIRLFASFAL